MVILKDILFLNQESFKKSIELLYKNWKIILTGFAYILINMVLGVLVNTLFTGILGIFGGLILTLATAALISNYLYLLQQIIRTETFDLEDFKQGFTELLRKIYSIFIIIWLANLLYLRIIVPILGGIGGLITTIITLAILVLLNPLPESIYLKFYEPWDTIVYAFEFIKENWLEWFIPNIVFIGALYLLFRKISLNIVMILFTSSINISIESIIIFIIGQVLFSFIMIYRGILFEKLSTSTRRKRIFMRDLYK